MAETPLAPERRSNDAQFNSLAKRIAGLEVGHSELKTAIHDNTELTKSIERNTSGLIEAWEALSGGLKVLNLLGKCAKWVTIVVGMVTALWTAWHLAGSASTTVDIPR